MDQFFHIGGEANGPLNLLEMIEAEGLEADLQLCLDAADAGSYPGSGQTWFDLSGNGNDFYRGATSSAQSDDPTFNGVAGSLTASEFFSFGAGDFFQEAADHTFAESWHKSGASFTVVAVFSLGVYLFSSINPFVSDGVEVRAAFNSVGFKATKSFTGVHASFFHPNPVLSNTDPLFVGVAVDESLGANIVNYRANGQQEVTGSAYNLPSGNATSRPYVIGLGGGGSDSDGGKLFCVAAWNRVLSNSELDALYARLQERYTGLP